MDRYNMKESSTMNQCKATLLNTELWKQFYEIGTEMIITKSGRRLFPSLHVQLSNLDPNSCYCILLEMVPVGNTRFKYSNSVGWVPAGTEDVRNSQRIYLHPESPASGDYWMSQPVSFCRMKLTNSPSPPVGHILLSSMHKYEPRIIIVNTSHRRNISWSPTKCISFPEAEFIAVTAYQNEKITKLKIDNNPFAKGFRDNGLSKTKRKRQQMEQNDIDVDKTIKSEVDEEENDRLTPNSLPPISPLSSPSSTTCRSPINIMNQSPPTQKPKFSECTYTHPIPLQNFYHPYFYGHYQLPSLYPTLWNQPHFYYCYNNISPSIVKEKNNNIVEKPKKLTDFSIKAITGLS